MENISKLKYIIEILDSAGVKWWIDHGTLLGIVREARLLPWDDDIDISIFKSDLERAFNALEKNRYKLSSHIIKTGRNVKVLSYAKIAKPVDICAYERYGDYYCKRLIEFPRDINLHAGSLRRAAWRRCRAVEVWLRKLERNLQYETGFFSHFRQLLAVCCLNRVTRLREKAGIVHCSMVPVDFFINFDTLSWRGFHLTVPSNPESYLCFRYGDSWHTPQAKWKWWRDDTSIKQT